LPQTSAKNQSPSQNLASITDGLEYTTFGDIKEVELQHATNNNASIIAAGPSQHVRGSNSTQTNGSAPHELPLQTPSPIQAIQKNVELEQLQVED
jgi:hypothetical protein